MRRRPVGGGAVASGQRRMHDMMLSSCGRPAVCKLVRALVE